MEAVSTRHARVTIHAQRPAKTSTKRKQVCLMRLACPLVCVTFAGWTRLGGLRGMTHLLALRACTRTAHRSANTTIQQYKLYYAERHGRATDRDAPSVLSYP
jgi:hypothetical protein